MIDLSTIPHHPCIEECTELICSKTQNQNKSFFRPLIAYYLAKMASCMRATIQTEFQGEIPINLYVINLGLSGTGKGYSVNIIENELINEFRKRFVNDTFPFLAKLNLKKIANYKASISGNTAQREFEELEGAFKRAGPYMFTFDSGTAPAIKQIRTKLLLAGCGSINYQCDEIGNNLIGATEVLNTYLELYDQGLIKQKLIKNTTENIRDEDLQGKTPANMLLFGTQSKLFDGGPTEDCFYSFLETGYARRCIFGLNQTVKEKSYYSQTPEQIYLNLINPSNTAIISKWKSVFNSLASPGFFDRKILLEKAEGVKLIEYKIECEKLADSFSEFDEIRKAELSHRYFKALKLAGAYAFIDKSPKITELHLNQAIKLVEESGKSFETILSREKAYMKLAKYIASSSTELTHADLSEALPFYKSSSVARNEMMTLAIAWGYKQNILIKKSFVDGIELFKGESLQVTDTTKLIVSVSKQFGDNYVPFEIPFDSLKKICNTDKNLHWCNHHFRNRHRSDENVINKFNLIVLDIDGTMTIKTAMDVLKEYKFIIYTTKSHTAQENRFRIIMPINYTLELDKEDYKEFMDNILNWFPCKTDEAANQISKKWIAGNSNAQVFVNDGELLNILPFIPRTTKNSQYEKEFKKVENLDHFERWFIQHISKGNRNNQLIKYALALVDSGLDQKSVEDKVKYLNKQLPNKLSEEELQNSIFITVAKKYLPKPKSGA